MNDKLSITDTIKLGPRLQTIASLVPSEASLGDIGTDHAYLPVYLIQKGSISKAIGVDIHQGPYQSARQTVSAYGLNDKIDIRLGNGLTPLENGEVDSLVIAGMGGITILDILGSNPEVIQGVTTLILQPQGAESRVRRELLLEGWKLLDERLIEEDNKIYTVICFSRYQGLSEKDIEIKIEQLVSSFICFHSSKVKANIKSDRATFLLSEDKKASDIVNSLRKIIWQLGPLILLTKEKLLESILKDVIANQHKVIREMGKTEREEVRVQAEALKQEVNIMEGIRTWLFQ